MIEKPMDVLTQYPVRKSKKRKAQFRADVTAYLKTLGYEAWEEKGSLGARNLVFGNQKSAKYLITAHYDTCPELPFPNFITPCNLWAYLGYQLLLIIGMFAIMGMVDFLVFALGAGGMIAFYTSYLVLLLILVLMMFGPANPTNANDNTSGVVTVLEIAAALPEAHREDVCFVLFDFEEIGLVGSASYRSAHKQETRNQMVLNLDCVGDGDEILFFPCGKIKKNAKLLAPLCQLEKEVGGKKLAVHKKGFSMYPSDQASFPLGVGIAALRRNKLVGLYMNKIHTRKDTILEEENVQLLTEALVGLIRDNRNETLEEIK